MAITGRTQSPARRIERDPIPFWPRWRDTMDDASATLTTHVMDTVRRRIAGRQLVAGARLPSVRAMAGVTGVSVSTVVDAYGRLVAEGVLQARRGSGFYVAAALPALSLQDVGPRLDREVDPLWVARQSLEAGDGLLKPGCGWLPADWLPHDATCAGRCARWRGARPRRSPTTPARSAWRRCGNCWRAAWASWRSRPRLTRSC
ncbi:MAG: putative L-lactate dehydrogenase operon regulatory protein [Paracidovorax wautersii]|uniref:Putative L-lactate dehydrogenase operon regulatory protein n=1 Tax=Paracidovorax wautersii TaxID=1177982 RepID=A0A7V8FM14_9BURK|nr:MAG: putative L-lactate dehydrogenase operon regulatory protein [Paracidovorax wautersii]